MDGIGTKILSFFGGGDGPLAKGLEIINKRVPDRDLREQLTHDFTVLQESQTHAAEMLAMEIEQDHEREMTKRIEAETQSNDTYTKRTRPKIARQSWYAGCAYIVVHILTTVFSPLIIVDIPNEAGELVSQMAPVIPLHWGLLMAIYSPALTYMGVRTFDKWKNVGP